MNDGGEGKNFQFLQLKKGYLNKMDKNFIQVE